MTKYENGIYDISNTDYHGSDAVSRSNLMLLDKSPYHFWYEKLSGIAIKKIATPAMNIGSAFHSLLLEPDNFNNEFAVLPVMDRRTTVGKKLYSEFIQLHGDKVLLTQDQYEDILAMVDNIKKHEVVNNILRESVFERSIFWTDKETGLQFKCRPDIWSSDMIADLKSTSDSSLNYMQSESIRRGYLLQAAMMEEACNAINKPVKVFALMACEKEPPYVPAIFALSNESMDYGRNQFKQYKSILKSCLDNNCWDIYPIQSLGIPSWVTYIKEE